MAKINLTSDGEIINSKYHDERGREIVSSIPVRPTAEQQRRMDIFEAQRRSMLQSLYTGRYGAPVIDETEDEADDFDIEGEEMIATRWEEQPEGFIPSDMDIEKANNIIQRANDYARMRALSPQPDEAPSKAKEGKASEA